MDWWSDVESSALSLSEEEIDLIAWVETDLLGGPLTVDDAVTLGKLLGRYRLPQVRRALEASFRARQPLRYAAAILARGAVGKQRPRDERRNDTDNVTYWMPQDSYDPWDT